ncbi:phytoene/squalene synthase family protein [Alienimonas californiensis]|uniref:All-trans-phytoene synthase n=1 Tax=Alienimonas californiensis TaxID=2527989 RepID=A0A517PEN2_9PLAN|nr:phytoene/squalene synthase family protein [Alienimonas californiensis]QDT17837.1 All-trans-phytoene synthase [Alienimonas californiensis]
MSASLTPAALSSADLDAAFAHCTRLARRTGKNFYWSFLTLPANQRRDMGALYAFMRVTDDLGDDPAEPLDRRRLAVANWRERTAAALHGEAIDPAAPHAAALIAFADVARRRGIPPGLPLDVIDGVAADLAQPPARLTEPRVFFEHAAGRDDYCYHVAGAVGLCCLHVWGCDELDGAAREPALACGRAFQRTNILRDVAEDAAAGRVYLPADRLAKFGVEPADLVSRPGDAYLDTLRDDEPIRRRIERLLRCEADETGAEYANAEPLFDFVSPHGRGVLHAMTRIYGDLLNRVEKAGIDVLARRVRVPTWRKAAAVAGGLSERWRP